MSACLSLYWQTVPDVLASRDLTAAEKERIACGPISLSIAGQLLGAQSSPNELLKMCRFRSDGVDSDELQRLAGLKNLVLSDVKMTWHELAASEQPVILHFPDDGHFVVANPPERLGNRIRVYDPRSVASYEPRDDVEAKWKGRCFTVNRADSPKGVDNILAARTWWVDGGPKNKSDNLAHYSVEIFNVSEKTVKLRVADTSCDCISTSLDQQTLEPGGSTLLRSSISLKKKRASFFERVWLADTSNNRWCTTFVGTAVGEVSLSHRAVFLKDAHRGDNIFASVVVRDRGDRSLKVTKTTVSDVETQYAMPPLSVTCLPVSRVLPNDIVKRHPAIAPGDYIVELRGTVPQRGQDSNPA